MVSNIFQSEIFVIVSASAATGMCETVKVARASTNCEPPSDTQLDDLFANKLSQAPKACLPGTCPNQLGMAVGVVTPSEIRTRAFGADKDPIRDFSGRIEIASLSKLFTSALVLMMAREGKINLNRPVSIYLPQTSKDGRPSPFLKAPYRQITVGQLLTHTSGLPEEPLALEEFSQRGTNIRNRYSTDAMYSDLREGKLDHAPGSRFEYSSFGYAVLTALIETVDKKSYGKSLHDRITGPLGMIDTNVNKNANLMPSFTPNGTLDQSQLRYLGQETLFDGAGGIKSTMKDLLKFASSEAGITKNIPANLRLAMSDSQKLQCSVGNVSAANCELSPNDVVSKPESVATVWESKLLGRLSHTGSVPGFKSYLVLDYNQSSPLVAVAFTNTDRPDAGAMFRMVDGMVNLYKFCQVSPP